MYRNDMYRSGTPLTSIEVVQIWNLSKNLHRSGMYQNGRVPNWPYMNTDIPVTETHTDTEMIDISKTHTESNTEKIFNIDTHIEMIA